MLDSLGISAVSKIKTYHQPISQDEYYTAFCGVLLRAKLI